MLPIKYFHPSSIPADVVEKSLVEIEKFFAEYEKSTDEEQNRFTRYAFGFACELKNMLVCGKTDNNS